MRRSWAWLLVAALLFTLVTPLPAAATVVDPPEEQEDLAGRGFHLDGGSLTTTSLGAWGGADVALGDLRFDADAGLEVYFFGVDMSQINYDGAWGWPPVATDYGAAVQTGITGRATPGMGSGNSAWVSINSCGTHGAWNDQGGRYTNADGYRSFLFQDWYRAQTGGQVGAFPCHQYNAELHMGPAGDEPECDTLDVFLRVTPQGGGAYRVETWSRLHKSSARLEGCPWEWNANEATTALNGGWRPTYDASFMTTSGNDFSDVAPYIGISNWGVTQVESHTVGWDEIVVLGQPRAVWVDDDYAADGDNDGHFWGEDAFAGIQDGVDAVADGGTVHVASGAYAGGILIDKPLTLEGVGVGSGVGAGMVPGFDSYQMGMHITAPGVAVSGLAFDGLVRENPGLAAQYGVLLSAGEAALSDLLVGNFAFGIGTAYDIDVDDCAIDGCAFTGITSSGIYFNPGADDNLVTACDIAAGWEGIVLDSSSGNWFESVAISGATHGIATYASEGRPPSGNTFLDVAFTGVGDAAPTVAVTSPVAGDRFIGGTETEIAWTASSELAGQNCDLEYTYEGGSWAGIASGVAGTAYTWLLPDERLTGVQVRVWAVDADLNRVGAVSGTFDIFPAGWGDRDGGDGGDGGGTLPPAVLPGVSADVSVDDGGTAASPDGALEVDFAPGAAPEDGALTITEPDEGTPPHAGMVCIGGKVYDITFENEDGEYVRQFSAPISLTFEYDAADLGGLDPADLLIYYWDEDLEAWVALPTTWDPETGTVTAVTDHLTMFALMYGEDMPRLSDMAGHWAAAEVLKLASLGIVSGYDDGTFKPDLQVTREQFVKMVAVAMGLVPVATPSLTFADAGDVSSWAAGYVQAAFARGIIEGLDGNRFAPQSPVSRAQAVVIIMRALDRQVNGGSTSFTDDAAIPEWAKGAVAAAVELGITTGTGGAFLPNDNCNRAQAAAMISRMLDVK